MEKEPETMVDVDKPLENPKLKALFAARRKAQSREEMAGIMEELAEEIVHNAHFLSVVHFSEEPESTGNGKAVFRKDSLMSVPMLTTQDGKSFYPAFIDWEELAKWEWLGAELKGGQPRTLILNFDDYVAMAQAPGGGDGVAIDPFSDNLILERETLERWKEKKDLEKTGHAEHRVEKGATVRLGEPKEYPHALADALTAQAKRERGIQKLWLRLMEQSGVFNWLLVVQFRGEKQKIFDALGSAALPHLMGKYLDIVSVEESFGRNAVDGVKPFYQKGFGLFG